MPDPLTVISTVGAIAGLLDVLTKSLLSLCDIRDQWKDANLTVMNMISQLSALRAALSKIQEWMDSEDTGGCENGHHQLVMDLDLSISCCRMLMDKIDTHLSGLERDADGKIQVKGKLKLLLGKQEMQNVQRMIENQTSALTLLLTACNSKTISEQKTLLEKSSSRSIFKQIRDDSSSLYVQRDTSSLFSRCSDSLSKLSMVFDFDRDLFLTRVYERAFRGSLKQNLRTQNSDSALSRTAAEGSKRIEKIIERDASKANQRVKILMIGSSESGKDTLFKQVRCLSQNGFSLSERGMYREKIQIWVLNTIKVFLDMLDIEIDGGVDVNLLLQLNVLYQKTDRGKMGDIIISSEIAIAAHHVWESEQIQGILRKNTSSYKWIPMVYFMQKVQEIASPTYVPLDRDILMCPEPDRRGLYEYRFEQGSLEYHLFDFADLHNSPSKRILLSQFEDVNCVLFVASLSDYDQVNTDGDNQLLEDSFYFSRMLNSQWLIHKPCILFLNNVTIFKERLHTSPLATYFPEYSSDPTDYNAASKFITDIFLSQRQNPMQNIYLNFVDATDTDIIKKLNNCVVHVKVQNFFRISS